MKINRRQLRVLIRETINAQNNLQEIRITKDWEGLQVKIVNFFKKHSDDSIEDFIESTLQKKWKVQTMPEAQREDPDGTSSSSMVNVGVSVGHYGSRSKRDKVIASIKHANFSAGGKLSDHEKAGIRKFFKHDFLKKYQKDMNKLGGKFVLTFLEKDRKSSPVDTFKISVDHLEDAVLDMDKFFG